MAQSTSKTYKLGKLTFTKTITKGVPELKEAIIQADKSEDKQKAIQHKPLPKGMLPGQMETGRHPKRINRGGELIRLKRR